MPPPVPASVKDGRMIAGSPTVSSASLASSIEWMSCESGEARPIRSMALRNSSRSSAMRMESSLAPMSSTP